MILASIFLGLLVGGLISYLMARFSKKPLLKKREATAVVEEQLKLTLPELLAEVENNCRIATEPWTGNLLSFETQVCSTNQDELRRLPTKLRADLTKAYDDMMQTIRQKHPQAMIHGVSVQKMAHPGVEVIIGMSKDAQFGPVLMFGLGGIWVEVLKDVSFRIVPLTRRDAGEMIREIKGYPLLAGYRGQPPVDMSNLEKLLLKVSDFVERNPEVKELDLNPIFAYRDGAVAVDARLILEEPS